MTTTWLLYLTANVKSTLAYLYTFPTVNLARCSPLLRYTSGRKSRTKVKANTSTSPSQIFRTVTEVPCIQSIVYPKTKCQCLSPTLTCGSREVSVPSWKDWPERSYETSLKTFLNMLRSTSMLFSSKDKVTATLCVKMRQRPLTAVKKIIIIIIYLFNFFACR